MSKIERVERLSNHPGTLPALPGRGEQSTGLADSKTVVRRSERSEAPTRPIPARESPERLAGIFSAPGEASRPARRHWGRWALFALLPLALIAGGCWYVVGGQIMSTDDAYVE